VSDDSMAEITGVGAGHTCDLHQRIPRRGTPCGGAVSQPHRRIGWFCSSALRKRCRLMLVIGS